MKRWVSMAAVLVGLVSAAGPAGAKAQTIRLTSVAVSHHDTKTGSVDYDSDYIGSRVIGHDTVTCTATGKSTARCRVTFVRPSFGTLHLSFRTSFTASSGHG